MDLKSFAEKNQPQNGAKQPTDNSNRANNATVGGMSENDIRRAIKYFGNMPNEQLMRELAKHISAKKRAGKEAEIQSIIERIKPFLSAEQRTRLDEIMRSIE